jgi:hypothetical protein
MTYKWHEFYKAAVLETDWSKMEERIRAAESAIQERQTELSQDQGGTPEESQAIIDALRRLDVLRADVALWARRRSEEAEVTASALGGGDQKQAISPEQNQ